MPAPQAQAARRRLRIGLTIGGVLIMVAIWSQSYNGREAVVSANRQGCERGARNLAATVNEYRIEQAGNAAVARAAGVPAGVRKSRWQTVAQQELNIRVLDGHIDRGVWRLLHNPTDQQLVRDGVNGRPPFRCDVAYPDAPLFEVTP